MFYINVHINGAPYCFKRLERRDRLGLAFIHILITASKLAFYALQ